MNYSSQAVQLLGAFASILNFVTGIYIFLLVKGDSKSEIPSIVTCVCACSSGFANIASLLVRAVHSSLVARVIGVASILVNVIMAGATLAIAFLNPFREHLGSFFCSRRLSCPWSGDRAIFMAFVLWCCAALFQTVYVTLYLTGYTKDLETKRPATAERDTVTSAASIRYNMVLKESQAFRYPLNRHHTDEEPFTLEAALNSKIHPLPTVPPGHEEPPPKSSQSSNYKFVPSHMTDGSHHRSWASTLPTAASVASPRSNKIASSYSEGLPTARSASPSKTEWSNWNLAGSKKSHDANKESLSSIVTHSSTSSKQSRLRKKSPKTLFHLPTTPGSRSDTSSFSINLLRKTHSKSLSQLGASSIDEDTPFDTLREESKSEATRSSRRSSLSPGKTPSERHRSGVFGLRPRLPGSPKSSWSHNSPRGSPTRRSFQASPSRRAESDFNSDAAFGEWDTSNLDGEQPFLYHLDTREVSTSASEFAQHNDTSRKASMKSDVSLWQGRSIRVASDGSVVARVDAADTTGRRVSTVGLDSLRPGIELGVT